MSEPFSLEQDVHLTGSHSHPQERAEYKGFLDICFHDTDRVPRGLDFFSIYQSGRNFLNGTSIYYGVRVHNLGDEALVVPYFSGFRYLPVYAYTFGVILNVLPPWYSYWTWIFVIELLLIFNIYIISKLPLSGINKYKLTAMWLAYSPYYVELHIGQQSMVTVTLLHLTVLYHVHRRKNLRDICYICSVLWKINTVLFIPIWIKLKKIKTVAALIFLTIALSFPYFYLFEGSFQEFISYFQHKFIAVGPNSLGFWSLAASLLQRAEISHDSIRGVLGFWTLSILILASLVTLLPRRINPLSALSMWICVYFITYQFVWEHHYVMLLPVFSITFLVSKMRRTGIVVWLCCALPTPYIFFNIPGSPMPQLEWSLLQDIFYHSTKIIPVFILFSFLVIKLIRAEQDHTANNNDAEDQLNIPAILLRWKDSRET
ncbi:DUF2029 domain-containing protein [bacterium]|nr:DUF2029 domain-containing protein [bacterium]